jgi:hypothetical protein
MRRSSVIMRLFSRSFFAALIALCLLSITSSRVVAQASDCRELLKPDITAGGSDDKTKIAWLASDENQIDSADASYKDVLEGVQGGDAHAKFQNVKHEENYTYDQEQSRWYLVSKIPKERAEDFLKCINNNDVSLSITDFKISSDTVMLVVRWVPQADATYAPTTIKWLDGKGFPVKPNGGQAETILQPMVEQLFYFNRDATQDFSVAGESPTHHILFEQPREIALTAISKRERITGALKDGKTCHVTLSGTGTLDSIFPNQTYNMMVVYDPDHPEQSRWLSSGPVNNANHPYWTFELSRQYGIQRGSPDNNLVWVVADEFALQPDGTIVASKASTTGSVWTGPVSCDE